MGSKNGHFREFGKFRLDAEKKVLWADEKPVNLQLKEIELLCLLTEHRGEILTKDEILNSVWADSFVEESNLTQHIYRLRKTFKEFGETGELIQTVPRRGYRFIGKIHENGTGDLVIERHSISKTVIEELENSDEPIATLISQTITRTGRRRYLLPALAGLVLLTVAAGSYLYNRQTATIDSPIRSIAVLPLKSIGDQDKSLGLGFADTLTMNLGRLENLTVLSTSTVNEYSKDDGHSAEIGQKLGVDAVIDGTLQRADGKLRVSLRLVRSSDGKQIWTDSFDEPEGEIFKLQDAIATQTAYALSRNLNPANRDRFLKHYTENKEAYQAYQVGRYQLFQDEYAKAIEEFERALEFDPKYVLAYSGLADTYSRWANRSGRENRVARYEKAKSYALQALALDENLGETHASLGWIRRNYDWDWAESEKHLRRALDLHPNYPDAHQRLALLYVTLGRTEEALPLSRRAHELSPVTHTPAWVLFCNRQYEESLAEYLRELSIAASPDRAGDGRVGAAMALTQLGKADEAVRLLEEFSPEELGGFKTTHTLAIARYRAGQTEQAAELLNKMEHIVNEGGGNIVSLATVYAVMGQKEKALSALEKGVDVRVDALLWIKTSPNLDSLRDDPRFREILRKMNL